MRFFLYVRAGSVQILLLLFSFLLFILFPFHFCYNRQHIELDREENADTDRFLEECVQDPTLRDKLSILSRTFKNRKRVSSIKCSWGSLFACICVCAVALISVCLSFLMCLIICLPLHPSPCQSHFMSVCPCLSVHQSVHSVCA